MTDRPRQRLDKWLWCARIVKTRPLAAGLVENGHVRLNRNKVLKPAHEVSAGDVLTIVLSSRVLVLHVEALAERRGPASTARLLYREEVASGAGVEAQKGDARGSGTC